MCIDSCDVIIICLLNINIINNDTTTTNTHDTHKANHCHHDDMQPHDDNTTTNTHNINSQIVIIMTTHNNDNIMNYNSNKQHNINDHNKCMVII